MIVRDFGSFVFVELANGSAVTGWKGKRPYLPETWIVNLLLGRNISSEITLSKTSSSLGFSISKEASFSIRGEYAEEPLLKITSKGVYMDGGLESLLEFPPTKIFFAPGTDFKFVFFTCGKPVILRNLYYDVYSDELLFDSVEYPRQKGLFIKVGDEWYSLLSMKNVVLYASHVSNVPNPLNKRGKDRKNESEAHFNHGVYEVKEVCNNEYTECFFVARRGNRFYRVSDEGVEEFGGMALEDWKKVKV